MSSWQLETVQSILDGAEGCRSDLNGPFARFLDAWHSDVDGHAIRSDVLGLISQILHHTRLTNAEASPFLDVALAARGISGDTLEKFGLKATPLHGGRTRLEPTETWMTDWIRGDPRWVDHAIASPRNLVAADGTTSTEARPKISDPLIADPAVTAVAPDVEHYMSPAQATALRAVALKEEGSTLHIVLPTGSGKSLVGIAPGLIEPGSTTVVVVPTIALAIDQEKQSHIRYRGTSLPRELAYHSDRSLEEKRAIRERLAAGTQRLLFTSPESLVHGLAPQLRELAQRGGLTYIVIDEAHLVYTWGLDFRPEFQLAAALIRELRSIALQYGRSRPKTVLMTATLSGDALRLNDNLFADGDSTFVGSTYLRTELRYLVADCSDGEVRKQRLVDAMHRLPKPAIVYTTKREDAEELTSALRRSGFGRTATFHGKIDAKQRTTVLNGWSGTDQPTSIDIVVGTTAFGVGVDQSDVRTVVHACIPRSVDRFYQEVGRAGRDGHTAVSLWLPVPGRDFGDSRIEITRLIGHTKGWNRWSAMVNRAVKAPTDSSYSMTIDLRTVPSHTETDNDHNRLWNRNIVTVLRHAGVIDIAPVHPPVIHRNEGESDSEWEFRLSDEWNKFRTQLDIIAKGPGSLDETGFEKTLRSVRSTVKSREERTFERIRRLLALDECWGRIFAEEYTLNVPNIEGSEQRPGPSCSGCPAKNHTRAPEDPPARVAMPRPAFPTVSYELRPALHQEMMDQPTLVLTYDSNSESRIGQAVTAAVNGGIAQILYSRRLTPQIVKELSRGVGTKNFVIVEAVDFSRRLRKLALPTVLITVLGDPITQQLVAPGRDAVPRIILAPTDTPDPIRPDKALTDMIHPNRQLSEFVRRV
ncbi:DEAD/DEAH box helicase [Rhodococcus hoagii]|uniref:DEAD/DEAH box helicase n=1 Tax=Rhodococcus hoagii TaxID=43767 RepID=A0AAE4ZEE9_RHOHA|nr:DEAD/DEAH box helicase [Prescottella equi]